MKLIRCGKCGDIVAIHHSPRRCLCGESFGYYYRDSNLYAVYGGEAIPLGILNGELREAIAHQPEDGRGREFTAFVIPKKCPTFTKLEKATTSNESMVRDMPIKKG